MRLGVEGETRRSETLWTIWRALEPILKGDAIELPVSGGFPAIFLLPADRRGEARPSSASGTDESTLEHATDREGTAAAALSMVFRLFPIEAMIPDFRNTQPQRELEFLAQ